jgi:hypothetical protein
MGRKGVPEVRDDPDRWAPPVGECVRKGREREVGPAGDEWVAGSARPSGGNGPDWDGFEFVVFCFFLFYFFFQILFKQIFKPF